MQTNTPPEIPATLAERNAWLGSSPFISDDIIEELTIQCKGYIGFGFDTRAAQARAMDALKNYGSDRVEVVPITQEMLNVGDFGFRLKE